LHDAPTLRIEARIQKRRRDPLSEAPRKPTSARRPILKLKSVLNLQISDPPTVAWKCKPCGAAVELTTDAPDDAVVRCRSCRARLGTAGDFREGSSDKLRARRCGQAERVR
jgi:DNA-directed RNA polymerase subunit RPC12/RpoP